MDNKAHARRRLLSLLRALEDAAPADSGTARGYLYGYIEALVLADLLEHQEHNRLFRLIDNINDRRMARI